MNYRAQPFIRHPHLGTVRSMYAPLQNRGRVVLTGTAATGASAPRTGIQWSITDWLERGRNLNTDAIRLNSLQSVLPPTDPARAAFLGWYAAWKPFYDQYLGPDASTLSQSNVSVNYDDFDRDLNRRKSQLDAIATQYNQEPASQDQKYTPSSDGDVAITSSDVPWWVWLGGGVAAAGLGYWGYKHYTKKSPRAAGRRAHRQ